MRVLHAAAILIAVVILAGIPGFAGISPAIENEPWGVTTYKFRYSIDVSNFGTVAAPNLAVRVATMRSFPPFQQVDSLVIENPGYATETDSENNTYAVYQLPQLNPGMSFTANFTVKVKIYSIDFVDGLTKQSPKPEYVLPEQFVESADTRIVNRSSILWSESSGLSDYSYRAYVWTTQHLTYETQPQERGAVWALKTRRGMCYEYSDLYMALMRAQSLPVKRVNGWGDHFNVGNLKHAEEVAHAWALVFTQNHGWIPVDPTFGDLQLYENYFKITDLHIILTEGVDHNFYRVTYTRTTGTNVQVDYAVEVLEKSEENLSLTRQIVLFGVAIVPFGVAGVIVFQVLRERRRRVFTD